MKLIYFYSLFYTLEDKLINISHHSLDLSCELGPYSGTTSSCSHGLLHKLKERGSLHTFNFSHDFRFVRKESRTSVSLNLATTFRRVVEVIELLGSSREE